MVNKMAIILKEKKIGNHIVRLEYSIRLGVGERHNQYLGQQFWVTVLDKLNVLIKSVAYNNKNEAFLIYKKLKSSRSIKKWTSTIY